jgi:NAD(P)-dependent dehydrogenase (short-subunit alcohol dehydrogenase family)
MKIVVLGGSGVVGQQVAHDLAARSEVAQLTIAGRNRAATEQTAQDLNGADVAAQAAFVDVTDPQAVAACVTGADVAVSCAGPFVARDLPAAQGAIQAEVPYLSLGDDVSGTRHVLELHESAKKVGVTVVTGCGFSPGITGLLVAFAADRTGTVEDIEISVAASLLDAKGQATAVHFLSALAQPAGMVFDHRFVEEPPATSPRLVFFPPPVGWVETFRCEHPEVISLLESYPMVRSLQTRIGIEERAVMDLARAAVFAGAGQSENLTRALLRLGAPFRPVLERIPPRGARFTAVRVDVQGRYGDRATSVSFGVAGRFVNLAAAPVVEAALELGSGRVVKPGVHTPHKTFEPSAFLRSLVANGLDVMELHPERV